MKNGFIASLIFIGLFIVGYILLIHPHTYPTYVERNGDEACQKCFGTDMTNFYGGSAWSDVYCSGERESLTLWYDGIDNFNCHDTERACKKEFLIRDSKEDKSCKDIEDMIEIDYFIPIQIYYGSKTCTTNETYSTHSTDTAGCRECAEIEWKQYYLDNCVVRETGEESNG